jgi:hypothetical protein
MADWSYKGKDGKGNETKLSGCSQTPDAKGLTWCYVKSKKCKTAKKSIVPDEKKMWKECDDCDCMGAWPYKGPTGKLPVSTNKACAETPDWKGHKWCYVVGGAKCLTAQKSAVPGEKKLWRDCADACQCVDKFKFKGKDLVGCVETPDAKGLTWCWVVGGNTCLTSKDSAIKGETRNFKECNPCNCAATWKYKGPKGKTPEKEYEGCSKTPDVKKGKWCYTVGGPACKDDKNSTVPGETREWKVCTVGEEIKNAKFLVSDDMSESLGWNPSFGSMCLMAFAGTAALGGLALLSLKRIQRGQARESQMLTSEAGETRETLMYDREERDQDNAIE